MVSWLSLDSSVCTSVSRRCRSVEKGLASKESKFGSPAPGTMNVLMPCEWPGGWWQQEYVSHKQYVEGIAKKPQHKYIA
jgi:hypothetical protein